MKKLIFLFLVAFAVIFTACGEQKNTSNPTITVRKKAKPVEINAIPEVIDEPGDQPFDKGVKKNATVKISTSMGDMEFKLYDETPRHRDNFLKLIKEGYYDGTLFHRVIQGFMIQGGDPDSKGAAPDKGLGSGGPGYTLAAEINPSLIHKKGVLSAARRGGPSNPNKRSSGCQFYVVQGKPEGGSTLTSMESAKPNFKYTDDQKETYATEGGTPFLDMDYTVFGEITSGLDVLDKIAATKTHKTDPLKDRPLEDIEMTITVISE